jgi:hypothetical protein
LPISVGSAPRVVAIEQLDAELVFELRYTQAEGRLLHVERCCSAREAAGIGSQNSIAQLAKFDRHAVIAPARYLSDIEAQFDDDRNIDFAL